MGFLFLHIFYWWFINEYLRLFVHSVSAGKTGSVFLLFALIGILFMKTVINFDQKFLLIISLFIHIHYSLQNWLIWLIYFRLDYLLIMFFVVVVHYFRPSLNANSFHKLDIAVPPGLRNM